MSKQTKSLSTFRDLPDDELRSHLVETRDALFRLQLGQHTNQVTSTAELQKKRRDIARIQTILRGRGLGLEAHGSAGGLSAAGGPRGDTKAHGASTQQKAK